VPNPTRITYPSFPPKTHWNPYGLQGLSTAKFERVVTKILKGEYVLLKLPHIERSPDEDVPIIDPVKLFFDKVI
jgi:hypothetical protein